MSVGIVVSGNVEEIYIRQASTYTASIGELLVAVSNHGDVLYQVTDLLYGSQIAEQQLELVAGLHLEGQEVNFFDNELRNYIIIKAKPLLCINGTQTTPSKVLPRFFTPVRTVTKQDMRFLINTKNTLHIGNLRNGSTIMDVPVSLDAHAVLSHHVLVSATTGKGKSNLLSTVLFSSVGQPHAFLVFDPHDEYYGRHSVGLKDHPKHDNVCYFSHDPLPGTNTLSISIRSLQPHHLSGVGTFSQPQQDAMYMYARSFGNEWVQTLFDDAVAEQMMTKGVGEQTLYVLRRKIGRLLSLGTDGKKPTGVFSVQDDHAIQKRVLDAILHGKTVVVDTSSLSGKIELLVSTIITDYVFDYYRTHKQQRLPVVSVVLEEAPRVIGKDVLEKGSNVFGTIAREGRKFNVGLFAITQLPSLIPRDILANMNTKIILGTEMALERQALVDSAAQDLSKDHRAIASLDKGEAIVTSNFARFAVPVKVPLFADVVTRVKKQHSSEQHTQHITGLQP